jgi:hypothetical protein
MSHDQLSKSLLVTFFPDFLRLTAPDSARRLRLAEATFVDKELFTDWPTGHRRELDLLVKVPREPGNAVLLVHVEIESRAGAGMDQRLWRYYMQIRLRHDLLVLPILVNWVQSCVKLTGERAAQYQRLLQLDENKEIQEMELTWLGKAEARGLKKGLVRGREEGKEEAELQHVGRMRQAVLHLVKGQFGTVPRRVRRRLEAIDSIEPLAEMIERIPRVRSAEELVADD